MLEDMYCCLEMYADNHFRDEWEAVYDEMFPEN